MVHSDDLNEFKRAPIIDTGEQHAQGAVQPTGGKKKAKSEVAEIMDEKGKLTDHNHVHVPD